MRPPTGNPISQKKHGAYNAVDYHSSPDINIYAPEDGQVLKWLLNAGDAGNELLVQGANGRHGFCHMQESFVQPGERVKKGQKLGIMGFTGRTVPAGPAGRHLHWVILQPDGTYVYPPSLVTEPFRGSESEDMIDSEDKARALFLAILHEPNPTKDAIKSIMNQPYSTVVNALQKYDKWRDQNDKLVAFPQLQASKQQGITPEQKKRLDALEALKEALK